MANTHSDTNPSFPPALTMDEVQRAEKKAQDWGITRRSALAVLTKSSEELTEAVRDPEGAEAFMDLLECLGAYLDWRKNETEMLEAVQARLMLALGSVHGGLED